MSASKTNSPLEPNYLRAVTKITGAVASHMEAAASGALAEQTEKGENVVYQLSLTKYWAESSLPSKRDADYSSFCTKQKTGENETNKKMGQIEDAHTNNRHNDVF